MKDELSPITVDDATLAAALEAAHIPSLMNALVHITGDPSIIRGEIRPSTGMDATFLGDPQGDISPEHQLEIRALALETLKRLRDRGEALPPAPDAALVREMLTFMVGEISDDYVDFLLAELRADGVDPYAQPSLAAVASEKRAAFQTVVIGAGMSGLLTAIRLKEAGVPFVVIEKNADVGGTWHENTYPGCRVDSPNHVYSYSFLPRDWPQHFSTQPVLRSYFEECADAYGLRDFIRFETEVKTARFDEARGTWSVEVESGGRTEVLEANAIVTAVGQLNRPKFPEIQGRESFEGVSFHSARWEHAHDLAGKRVGVIGTGASAFQFLPIVAKDAAQVTVFQRTAPWTIPNPDYMADVPDGTHWLLNHVPFYARWFRFSMFWRTSEGLLGACRRDAEWSGHSDSISAENDMVRMFATEAIKATVEDEALAKKATPDYPFGSKRALIDDGSYLTALKRDNVELTTDPIIEITPTGVRTQDGTHHTFDVLIFATGFYASRFLYPMKFYGRDGRELREEWGDDPRAYLGITMPGFPNLFCCYGPNTNIVVNGSIIFFSECEVRYILGCLAMLMNRDVAALDCKKVVHDAYNQRIDRGNLDMAWSQPGVNTWYKNEKGRVTQNWPFTLLEFWQQTRDANPDDYEFLEARR